MLISFKKEFRTFFFFELIFEFIYITHVLEIVQDGLLDLGEREGERERGRERGREREREREKEREREGETNLNNKYTRE